MRWAIVGAVRAVGVAKKASNQARARSVFTAAAVASRRARFSHSCGINVPVASLGLSARTCERSHGLFSPASRPTAHGFQPDLVCKSYWSAGKGRAGSWGLGPRNVSTRPSMVGFPVRCGPLGRSEEQNNRQPESAC